MKDRRALWLGPFGVIAFIAVLSSAAYACTVYRGNMTVSGTASSTGTGDNSGMGYCGGTTPPNAGATKGTAFTVSVAPSTACASSLGTITVDVNYKMGPGGPRTTDCMTDTVPIFGVNKIGTMSITSGSASGSYTIPTTESGTGDVQICVSRSNGSLGMQVPATLS